MTVKLQIRREWKYMLSLGLAISTLLPVGKPAEAHQVVAQYNDTELGISVTAELLEPYGEDVVLVEGSIEIESFYWGSLTRHPTCSQSGIWGSMQGSLDGNPSVTGPSVVMHVTADDPETEFVDESHYYFGYGLSTNMDINPGTNTARAAVDGTVQSPIIILSTADTHILTGQEFTCF